MSFESKGLKNAPTFACNDTKFSQKMTWAVKNLFVLFFLLKTSMLRAQFDPGIDILELLHPMPTTEDSIRVKTLVTLPTISELIVRTDTVTAKPGDAAIFYRIGNSDPVCYDLYHRG